MTYQPSDLLEARGRYFKAQFNMRCALDELATVIKAMEDRIIELTDAAIELHKAKEDKP